MARDHPSSTSRSALIRRDTGASDTAAGGWTSLLRLGVAVTIPRGLPSIVTPTPPFHTLGGYFWELRTQIEGELRELTEAQQRLDTFVQRPTADAQDAILTDLHARLTVLVRTNERVLRILYDAVAQADRLREGVP
jgi:hypothetical protein